MDVATNEMTHDDIWDDSLLVDSWNQALEEYKKYHSIHARGGKVEDILTAEAQPSRQRDAKPETGKGGEPIEGPDLDALGQGHETSARDEGAHASQDQKDGESASRHQASSGGQDAVHGGVPPQVLLQSVRDEGLKKLLMSWYYAGYYTGLYEGQQKEPRES
ncbi:putative smn family protein smn1 protein [Phaeoacremonium minimum UCRPA7]|uniref:Putative smn family protein smn1 protein n=1 Tax=Phaeoacremonium minimum (strain UCR-PA7) TaxID=1286976 RepID=R8BL25_PHAM7|nr:putative smn family protein smn1 protein [Phaeoacremonium minimum UCRPA7]EOO00068.1 putative smn family protein smn1 protein [Phaeoacremonium minimum UCRPA7]